MEKTLDQAHRHLGRAGFLVVRMLVMRVFRRSWAEEAQRELQLAAKCLETLISRKEGEE